MMLASSAALRPQPQLRATSAPRRGAGGCPARRQRAPACCSSQGRKQQDRLPGSDETSRQSRERHAPSSSSSSNCGSSPAAAPIAALVSALLLPLADPAAALAGEHAGSLAHSGVYWACLGLGSATVVTTLLLTSRFLMSYFPSLEKRAKQRPGASIFRALTAVDPVLDPITRGVFKMTEQGDLNYGAMAALAVSSAVMTTLLGHGGLMVHQVPDLGMLQMLQFACVFQHVMLLPMWAFVVFRYFMLL